MTLLVLRLAGMATSELALFADATVEDPLAMVAPAAGPSAAAAADHAPGDPQTAPAAAAGETTNEASALPANEGGVFGGASTTPGSDATLAADELSERNARWLDELLAPAAGPLGLQREPLRTEPFLEERRELARQQEALGVRQIAIDVAEERLRAHLDELTALKAEIDASLAQLRAQDEDRLATLVTLYEAMNPKKAAVIFDELSFDVLAPLSLAISERKLAPIIAAMQPQVARELTAELARRRHDELMKQTEPAP